MSVVIPLPADLGFANNDIVQLQGDLSKGERNWALGSPDSYSRVHEDDWSIEFRLLAEDRETDFAALHKIPGKHFVRHESSLLGNLVLDRYMYYLGESDWTWYASRVAKPDTVNLMSELFEDRGAHTLPLVLQAPDLAAGNFMSITLMRALDRGYIPVSTHPYYFLHDMGSHAEQLKSTEAESMAAYQSIAGYASSSLFETPGAAHKIANRLANMLDYHSFRKYFNDYAINEEDLILTSLLHIKSKHVTAGILSDMKDIIAGYGFTINDENEVGRPARIMKYYADLMRLQNGQLRIEFGV